MDALTKYATVMASRLGYYLAIGKKEHGTRYALVSLQRQYQIDYSSLDGVLNFLAIKEDWVTNSTGNKG
ncbi:hypothetical protein H6G89_19020 [Oscillatoria sp. FACHB-1407]|uniref:hypothetical protein n=1 Tax=Oscillatoria sp. FACHB-1407 TaxID=2692847 RepID=UPI0016855BF2|nr:hypothetical protein [Oscillatoria sp. FACHB-1407]MBD2463131.1 hypothetical protein [Oscillatoria sp. FACHB-1407]